jgi:hypothetical protein
MNKKLTYLLNRLGEVLFPCRSVQAKPNEINKVSKQMGKMKMKKNENNINLPLKYSRRNIFSGKSIQAKSKDKIRLVK